MLKQLSKQSLGQYLLHNSISVPNYSAQQTLMDSMQATTICNYRIQE